MAIPDDVIICQALGDPYAAAYALNGDGVTMRFVGWIIDGKIDGLATEVETNAMLTATLRKGKAKPT